MTISNDTITNLIGESVAGEYPERPPVHLVSVIIFSYNFRCHIFESAAKGRGPVRRTKPLGETEIDEDGVSLVVQQHVRRFNVPVNDPGIVEEIFES